MVNLVSCHGAAFMDEKREARPAQISGASAAAAA